MNSVARRYAGRNVPRYTSYPTAADFTPLITPTPGGLTKIREYLKAGEQYLSPVDGFTVKGH